MATGDLAMSGAERWSQRHVGALVGRRGSSSQISGKRLARAALTTHSLAKYGRFGAERAAAVSQMSRGFKQIKHFRRQANARSPVSTPGLSTTRVEGPKRSAEVLEGIPGAKIAAECKPSIRGEDTERQPPTPARGGCAPAPAPRTVRAGTAVSKLDTDDFQVQQSRHSGLATTHHPEGD